MNVKYSLQFAAGLAIMWLLAGTVWFCTSLASRAGEKPAASTTGNSQADNKEKIQVGHSALRHVVLFQFKDTSSAKEISRVVDAFLELPKAISQIADFEHGVNNSPEGLNEGLSHCFLITFRSEEDRDAYLNHPAHQAFVEIVKQHLQKAVVVDYWTRR